MIDFNSITSHVSTAAADGFTRAELLNLRALFRQAKADGLSKQVLPWLQQNYPSLVALYQKPTLAAVDSFEGPRQADSMRREPAAVTKDAGAQIRAQRRPVPAEFEVVSGSQFLSQLETTPGQQSAMRALAENPQFRALWNWFESFPGGNPLQFSACPGLTIDDCERFGGYARLLGLLVVNPTKAEHVTNPAELVHTVVHELLHAALDAQAMATRLKVSIPHLPFADGVSDAKADAQLGAGRGVTRRDQQALRANKVYMDSSYGPGGSNPKAEFMDLNAGAQEYILGIVKEVTVRGGAGSAIDLTRNQRLREMQK